MFNYDAFEEEGLLRPNQVSNIRYALEDLVERLYNPCIVDEEVDAQIRKMANELGVYVPKINDTLFNRFGAEYIEDKIFEYFDLKHIYNLYSASEAIELLLIRKSFMKERGLTTDDIVSFCNSDLFHQRKEEFRVF